MNIPTSLNSLGQAFDIERIGKHYPQDFRSLSVQRLLEILVGD